MFADRARNLFMGNGALVLAEFVARIAPERSGIADFGGNASSLAGMLPVTAVDGANIVLALGVAEHVSENLVGAFLDQVCAGATHVLFAATAPGQGGQHLVNCQWPSYWVKYFAARGFAADDAVRRRVWDDERFPIWCRQNLLLFVRGGTSASNSPSGFDLVHPHMFRQAEAQAHSLALLNSALQAMWANRTQHRVSPQVVDGCRIAINEEAKRLVQRLDYSNLTCLEVSGNDWQNFGFKEHVGAAFPQFDIYTHVARRDDGQGFDVIIAEQILHHVPTPWVGVGLLRQCLNPGGHLLVTTPFFLRVRPAAHDYTRWTEAGLRNLFEYAGFASEQIVTGSWGNQVCMNANVAGSVDRREPCDPADHALDSEPDAPIMVWAFARN